MTRWLVNEGRLGDGAARRLVRTAGRLAQWPVLARAFAEGTVSAGQVEHVAQRVRPHHVELFAEHEAALVPALALLDLDATITVVREWSDKADALIDTEPAEPKASTLHVNQVGDRGRLDSDLTGDDLAIVAEALRLATRSDDDTDGRRRTRAERAADALVDMSRRFLRDHETPKTAPGRQRPGVNVVIDAPALAALELRELGIGTVGRARRLPHRPAHHRGGAGLVPVRPRPPHRRPARWPPPPSRATTSPPPSPPPSAATPPCAASSPPAPRSSTTAGPCRPSRSRSATPSSSATAAAASPAVAAPSTGARSTTYATASTVGADSVANCVLLCAHHHHVLHRDGWSAHLEPDGTLAVAGPHDRHWVTRPPGPTNGPSPPRLTYGA